MSEGTTKYKRNINRDSKPLQRTCCVILFEYTNKYSEYRKKAKFICIETKSERKSDNEGEQIKEKGKKRKEKKMIPKLEDLDE